MPEGFGYFDTDFNAAAVEYNFFGKVSGNTNNELDPGNVGSKQGNDDPTMVIGYDAFERLTDFRVGNSVPLFFNIGRVGQQGQNTPLAECSEFVQIGRHAAGCAVSNFVVTGVNQ